MHMLGAPLVKKQSLTFWAQTWPRGHSKVEVQGLKGLGWHWCTQILRPSVVLMQTHCFRVFRQRLQQPAPRRGHVGAASATVAVPNTPAAPKALAAANLSARLLEMVPASSPLARSSKNCSLIVALPLPCYYGHSLLLLQVRGKKSCREP